MINSINDKNVKVKQITGEVLDILRVIYVNVNYIIRNMIKNFQKRLKRRGFMNITKNGQNMLKRFRTII
jgi:hypothetical protein